MIRVVPGVAVDTQLCHYGGPTGINTDLTSSAVVLHHYGNGVGIGSVLPARTGVAIGMPDHVFAQAVALPGDSGSGVISDDGRAVGVLVTVGVHSAGIGTGGVDAGIVGITRFAPQLARTAEVLEVDLSLATAPPL